jgi:hypothetical protein
MRITRRLIPVLTLLFAFAAGAQDSPAPALDLAPPDSLHVQLLTTVDGSRLVGRIISITAKTVRFKTKVGVLDISIDQIKKIKRVPKETVKSGEYRFPNPNTTRLFFAPTARTLGRGSGYFADYYLFFPGGAYGINDHFSMAGGLSLIPGVGFDEQIYYLAPKVGFRAAPKLDLAAGFLVVRIPDEKGTAGVLYGVATYGPPDASLTAGLGYGFVDSNRADKPFAMLGGEKRLSKRVAFVSENWIFPGIDQPIVSYGLRFFSEQLSVDLALFTPLGEDAFFPGIPYVDFVFNF